MSLVLTLSVFALTTAAVYLLLERRLFAVVLGSALLGNAVNLIVAAAGRVCAVSAVLPKDGPPPAGVADPVPQALILTAIVISMAVTLYLITAMAVSEERDGVTDLEAPPASDEPERDAP